ncbi:GspH/FimT family pseudopilin [Rhodoferax sp.]|uniref:GspH/FimT family pseudopilin n=1 Tax=Rhodoferax sp. TaxID=50421 RepID=UPI002611EE52|nr:GspH/FimT family pseudopilin [Rhodoferax sp.]MDD2919236.1 GspH/FimT family pseudopilin [Rhodoferax sp.]
MTALSRPQNGFTMIELVVAMAVLGILMAIAMPSFVETMGNSRIRSVAESVTSGLQFARSEAVRRNEKIRFSLDSSTGNWTVRRSADNTCVFDGDVLQTRATTSSSTAVVVTTFSDVPATAATTAQVYVYGPNGSQAQDCMDAVEQFVALRIDSSSLAADDSRDLRLVAPPVGRARLCDPHVTTGDTRECPTS